MSPARKAAAVLVAVFVVLTSLLAQLLFNLERKAFSPETYQRAFANEDFYNRLPGILAGSLGDSLQADRLPSSMRGLTPQIWEGFLRGLLPPETVRGLGDQVLASLFAYLNNEADSARVSLQPLKERMVGEAGMQAVLNLMRTQPACTLEEMARIAMAALDQQAISLCNPPQELYPLVAPLIRGQLQLLSAALPDELVLAGAKPLRAGEVDPRARLWAVRLAMRLSPIVPLLFLIVLTIVAVRGIEGWLAWWGAPIMIIGLLGSLAGVLGAPLSALLLRGLLASRLPAFVPSALLGDGSQLAAAVVDQLLKPVLFQSLLLALVGGLMLALAFILGRLRRRI